MLVNGFLVERPRFSVVDYDNFIIQVYTSDKYKNDYTLGVSLDSEEMSLGYTEHRDIESKKTDDNELLDIEYIYTVKLPEDYTKYKYVIVSIQNNETREKTEVFKMETSELRKNQASINCCIDYVGVTNGQLSIRGWAISSRPITITATFNGKDIDIDLNKSARSDVIASIREYSSNDLDVGFTVNCKVSQKGRFVLELTDGEKTYRESVLVSGRDKVVSINRRRILKRGVRYIKKYGVGKTILKMKELLKRKVNMGYMSWRKKAEPNKKELELQRQEKFAINPRFSIIVPLYKTPIKYLDELMESINNQTYSNWEVCFSDGGNDGSLEKHLKKYAVDNRVKYSVSDRELGIADNTNEALKLVQGDFIVLGDHDDLFAPNALYECVKVINGDGNVDVIYTDEDKVSDAKYFEPNFKPDFNIDLLRSNNYICHMFVVKKELVDKIGVFNPDYDGAQDYDFIFRCIENANSIYHIAKVLYHWRYHVNSTAGNPESKLYAFEAGKRAIEAHYDRLGIDAVVEMGENLGFYKTTYDIKDNPLVSIVIPNKDHISDLDKCIKSINEKTTYSNYEIVVIENNSTEKETFDYYGEIEKASNIKIVYWKDEFNYSAINNFGVQHADGEYILFLNNDTEVINDEWLSQMVGFCQREEVGIVGARLYFDDNTIQHAGVVVGYGGIAGHVFTTLDERDGLYQSRTKVAVDYSAVTAACMMTKKSLFLQVGGFDEKYKVAFNDIDYCMKIRDLEKLVVYNPYTMLYHYESKSRGAEDTSEKIERFYKERERFINKWGKIIDEGDPYYNVNLTLDKADFSLRVL